MWTDCVDWLTCREVVVGGMAGRDKVSVRDMVLLFLLLLLHLKQLIYQDTNRISWHKRSSDKRGDKNPINFHMTWRVYIFCYTPLFLFFLWLALSDTTNLLPSSVKDLLFTVHIHFIMHLLLLSTWAQCAADDNNRPQIHQHPPISHQRHRYHRWRMDGWDGVCVEDVCYLLGQERVNK